MNTDHLLGVLPFFLDNREMEDDLVLNLATDNPGPTSTRVAHVKKGGKWTDR